MDGKFIALIAIVFALFLLNRLYVWADKKRKREAKKEESLNDSQIIALLDDPLTGEKAKFNTKNSSSDEGVVYDENKKTSDNVIDKFFTQEDDKEKQFVLMKNFLLDEGFRFQKFNSEEIDALENTKLLSSYKNWSCGHSYRKDAIGFFIAYVTSPDFRSKHNTSITTPVLICWIKDFNFIGHYCFYKKGIVEYVIEIFADDEEDIMHGYETIILKKSGMEKQLRSFLKTIQFDGDLEIEINDSDVFIKVSNRVSEENLAQLYQTLKNPKQ